MKTAHISTAETVYGFFAKARESHGIDVIARRIGLHPNTVARWEITKQVPEFYLPDFQRILGKTYDGFFLETGDRVLDQYYTKPETAKRCYRVFREVLQTLGVNARRYTFVEPSMGEGCFYDLLPPTRRIGIDLDPRRPETVHSDFLEWKFPSRKCLVIGNPPFGLRGHLALNFLNYAAQNADCAGFILPKNFGSDGKGAPGKRVSGYTLAFSTDLDGENFQRPDGTPVIINTVFQVWTRVGLDRIQLKPHLSCTDYIKVLSLSDGGTSSSTRNKRWLDRCDVYLPSTTYAGMRAYSSFEALPHRRGYGVVIHQCKKEIKKLLVNHDWRSSAFQSSNSAQNLRTSLIENVVIRAGYINKSLLEI